MKYAVLLLVLTLAGQAQNAPGASLLSEIEKIQAVDNHTHIPKVVAGGEKDSDYDARDHIWNLPGSVHLRSKWTRFHKCPLPENGSQLCGCPDGHNRTLTQNPVRRGLVARAEDWKWNSFRHLATGEDGVVEIESQWTARKRERLGTFLKLKVRRDSVAHPSPKPGERMGHPPAS